MTPLGDAKGILLRDIIAANLRPDKRRLVVEIGAYCGYSAVLLSSILEPDDVILSIETDSNCVEWTKTIVNLAEVTNHHIFHGNVESSLPYVRDTLTRLNKDGNTQYIYDDMILPVQF